MDKYINLEPLRKDILNDDFDNDIVEQILYIVDTQPTADVIDCPKWISVEERLPEANVRVLVRMKNHPVKIDTDRIINLSKWARWSSYVTHWCPIPESLKEGAEG